MAGDYAVLPGGQGLRAGHDGNIWAERERALWHRPGLRLLRLLHLLLLVSGEFPSPVLCVLSSSFNSISP